MVSIINKGCCWIRGHVDKRIINNISILVVIIYYFVGLLSYITVPIDSIYRMFVSGSSVAVIVRALMTAMMCIYCLLVLIVNQEKIRWRWLMVFVYILLFTAISTIISPHKYNYIYVESLYRVVHWEQASAGFGRLFTMYLSSISDFAMAFCFMFILPLVINNKKQLLYLLLPIVVIALLECVYSFLTEKDEYIKLINMIDPEYGGYNVNIGASFGNKEDWGAFCTVAFCCSIMSIYCILKDKGIFRFVKIVLFFSAIIIFIFSVLSLCKTAIISQFLFIIAIAILLVVYFFKKNKILFFLYTCSLLVTVLLALLFYIVPSFHSKGFLNKIYNVTYTYIISPITNGAIGGRTSIWMRIVNNLRTYNVFFGLSKGGVSTYSQVLTIEGQSGIHNGFAYFFCSYGVIGLFVYLLLLAKLIKNILKVGKIDFVLGFVLIGIFLSSMVFSLSESEILIVSGSTPVYIFNILLCSFTGGVCNGFPNKEERLSHA